MRKWQTSEILSSKIEKSKHVHIDIGGSSAANLHFHAGSKDVAQAILAKLESSRSLSTPAPAPAPAPPPPPEPEPERPRSAVPKAVHFDIAEPVIIPSGAVESEEEPEPEPEPYEEEPAEQEQDGDGDGGQAVALYDFTADGDDELSVHEGEPLWVIERDSEDWWKVRNSRGEEGVVPASYIEVISPSPRATMHK